MSMFEYFGTLPTFKIDSGVTADLYGFDIQRIENDS